MGGVPPETATGHVTLSRSTQRAAQGELRPGRRGPRLDDRPRSGQAGAGPQAGPGRGRPRPGHRSRRPCGEHPRQCRGHHPAEPGRRARRRHRPQSPGRPGLQEPGRRARRRPGDRRRHRRTQPAGQGVVPQPKRWRVEQTYGILILHRRLVRDYEHRCPPSASRVLARDPLGLGLWDTPGAPLAHGPPPGGRPPARRRLSASGSRAPVPSAPPHTGRIAVPCGVRARTTIRSPSSAISSMTSGNSPEKTICTGSLTSFTRRPTTPTSLRHHRI